MSDRFLDLVTKPPATLIQLFNRLNPCQRLPSLGFNNCDDAAATMFDFLATGAERAARCLEANQAICRTPNNWTEAASLVGLMRFVRRGGHGTQVIVLGIRDPNDPEFTLNHVFNMVNIDPPIGKNRPNRGSVHAVDAFLNLVVPSSPNPTFAQSLAAIRNLYVAQNRIKRFKFRTASYRVSLPNNEGRCPDGTRA